MKSVKKECQLLYTFNYVELLYVLLCICCAIILLVDTVYSLFKVKMLSVFFNWHHTSCILLSDGCGKNFFSNFYPVIFNRYFVLYNIFSILLIFCGKNREVFLLFIRRVSTETSFWKNKNPIGVVLFMKKSKRWLIWWFVRTLVFWFCFRTLVGPISERVPKAERSENAHRPGRKQTSEHKWSLESAKYLLFDFPFESWFCFRLKMFYKTKYRIKNTG